MATILESLKGVSAYPVPLRTIVEVAEVHSLQLEVEATRETMEGNAYKLAKADLLLWLSLAPNVAQGGQSYSFTDEQRRQLRNQAMAIYKECGEERTEAKPIYGYKGSRL